MTLLLNTIDGFRPVVYAVFIGLILLHDPESDAVSTASVHEMECSAIDRHYHHIATISHDVAFQSPVAG